MKKQIISQSLILLALLMVGIFMFYSTSIPLGSELHDSRDRKNMFV